MKWKYTYLLFFWNESITRIDQMPDWFVGQVIIWAIIILCTVCIAKHARGFVVLCFVVAISYFFFVCVWFVCSYSAGLLDWHWGYRMLAAGICRKIWVGLNITELQQNTTKREQCVWYILWFFQCQCPEARNGCGLQFVSLWSREAGVAMFVNGRLPGKRLSVGHGTILSGRGECWWS